MPKKASKKKQAHPDFETSLQHLKEALGALESEELTLEESLAQYEAGIKYLGHCHGALEVARQKIEQLVSIDENGQVVTKPFDGTASDKITSSTRRSRSSKSASATVGPQEDGNLEDEDELRSQLEDSDHVDDSDGLF
jgi:exodeoxyribonuclease VII small subunit